MASVSELTEEQYLAIERAAEFKSEFLDGVMYPMSGGSMRHADLASNIVAELRAILRGGECKAFNSDLRVGASGRMFAYPDVSIVCGKPMLADEKQDVLLNPVVLLGAGGENFEDEQYIRQDATTWTLRDHLGQDDELKIDFIGIALALRRIYDGVDLTA